MFPRRLTIPLTATWLALGCGKSDDNCPGQCPDESVLPSMTIVTADSAPSIASAMVSGPCTRILTHSAGEVGVPTGYAAVQVSYQPQAAALEQSNGVAPLCTVQVTSLWGDVETISAQVTVKAYETACCPYGTCCPKTMDALTRRYHLAFDTPTQTVAFLPAPDGGDSDAADAPPSDAEGVEASTVDGSLDATVLDLSALDAPDDGTGSQDLDGILEAGALDVADLIDLPGGA